MTVYEAETAFEELLDKAKDEMSAEDFEQFLDHIDIMLAELS